MDLSFPYSRYTCVCSASAAAPTISLGGRDSGEDLDEADQDQTFNPHDPRASFLLHPIDQLLFCNECDQIRCPRCWTEEILYWYCPSCQFEVPSSTVKSEGNRCTRHCYDCPICAATLAVTAIRAQADKHLKPEDGSASNELHILQCQSCDWSTLDIGVKFSRATKITEQMNKEWRERTLTAHSEGEDKMVLENEPLSHESAFANLSNFYKEQLSESRDQSNPYSSSPYSSPANLARIMSLYGGLSHAALKKSREKPQPMCESANKSEGMQSFMAGDTTDDDKMIDKMQTLGFEATTSASQRTSAPRNYDARFVDQLWPTATPLRTRRIKRCKACRQQLVRPEPKVGSLRFKIRLLAVNWIQRLSIRPLQSSDPIQNTAFNVRVNPPPATKLKPHQTHQYILTVRNPIFESVKITLGTPAITPGRVASRVTILCPSFTVGPAGDMWDEAISSSSTTTIPAGDGSRRAAMESLTGGASDAERQPEAGKVWERTRSSTSVVVEIVPGALKAPPSIVPKTEAELQAEELHEDEDVLEIPIYVRAEWEADAHDLSGEIHLDSRKRERVSKELAYWCVIGVGRIAEG